MDSSMNERMPTYLHVPFCCCVLSSKIFPIFPVCTFDLMFCGITTTILFVDLNLTDADCKGHDAIP